MRFFILTCYLIAILCFPAQARPGPIDKASTNTRRDIIDGTRFVEVQRVASHPASSVYRVLATQSLNETQSRALLRHFRQLPFERVTIAQCHEPGFALRLLDADKKLIAEISLCWMCHNLRAAPNSLEQFRAYQEDFAADSQRGKAFQSYLEGLFSKSQ